MVTARSLPGDTEFPRIWISPRYQDEWNRYAIVMRGGSLNDIQLLRFQRKGSGGEQGEEPSKDQSATPDIGMAYAWPLPFEYKPGEWYTFTIDVSGPFISVYINDSARPVFTYRDPDPPAGRFLKNILKWAAQPE